MKPNNLNSSFGHHTIFFFNTGMSRYVFFVTLPRDESHQERHKSRQQNTDQQDHPSNLHQYKLKAPMQKQKKQKRVRSPLEILKNVQDNNIINIIRGINKWFITHLICTISRWEIVKQKRLPTNQQYRVGSERGSPSVEQSFR